MRIAIFFYADVVYVYNYAIENIRNVYKIIYVYNYTNKYYKAG